MAVKKCMPLTSSHRSKPGDCQLCETYSRSDLMTLLGGMDAV